MRSTVITVAPVARPLEALGAPMSHWSQGIADIPQRSRINANTVVPSLTGRPAKMGSRSRPLFCCICMGPFWWPQWLPGDLDRAVGRANGQSVTSAVSSRQRLRRSSGAHRLDYLSPELWRIRGSYQLQSGAWHDVTNLATEKLPKLIQQATRH